MNKFILLSHPRSGTTYFASKILKVHPDIICLDEIFNRKKGKEIHNTLEKKYSIKPYYDPSYKGDRIAFIENYYNKLAKYYDVNNVGFKLFHSQLGPGLINTKLINTYKIILLRRMNMGKAAISWEIGVNTKQWGLKDKKDLPEIEINPEKIYEFINFYTRKLNTTENLLIKRNIPYLLLYYENLFTQQTLSKVGNYLNLDNYPKIKIVNKSLNNPSRYKKIKNIEIIRQQIIDMGYQDIYV